MAMKIEDLYQEVIIEHSKHPRNYGKLEGSCLHVVGDNPLCGDKVELFLLLEDNIIKNISFEGKGCAISRASASIMTETVKGKTVEEALGLFNNFHGMIMGGNVEVEMGKMAVFSKISDYPSRVKCVTMSWWALKEILTREKE